MASGDRTKVWFPEIEVLLVSRWHEKITCEELVVLAADLTAKTRELRDKSGILPPVYFCPSCRTFERARPPIIHGGSVLFAARRLGLIGDARLSELKRLWDNHAERLRRAKARQTRKVGYREQNRASNARVAAGDASGATGLLRLIKGPCRPFAE